MNMFCFSPRSREERKGSIEWESALCTLIAQSTMSPAIASMSAIPYASLEKRLSSSLSERKKFAGIAGLDWQIQTETRLNCLINRWIPRHDLLGKSRFGAGVAIQQSKRMIFCCSPTTC